MKTAVFILAGGAGLRLWPLSCKNSPKQFLPLLPENKSFFEKTLERALKITSTDNVYVLTVKDYKDIILRCAPKIPEENIFTESEKRNTAPGIAVAMMSVQKRQGNTLAVIMPSDHFIPDEEIFIKTVSDALSCAEHTDGLVTIGICPTRPATNYGYIRLGDAVNEKYHKAVGFTEKPDSQTAQSFLLNGGYLWNSGIFIWKTSAILSEYKKYLPDVYEIAEKICSSENPDEHSSLYKEMPSVSVDYGILEKSSNLYTVRGSFPWDDIGSWESFSALCSKDAHGNASFGSVINIDSSDCLTVSLDGTAVTAGAKGLCVINTGKLVLVFPKDKADEILKLTLGDISTLL